MTDLINDKINEYLDSNHITRLTLGKLLSISTVKVYSILRKKAISCEEVYKISQALNHDFFQYFQPNNKKDETIQQLNDKVAILESENEKLRTERDLLIRLMQK